MYDVKQWLEGCIVSSLFGHIHHHQFKLTKGPDGKAWLFYKKWSMSEKCSPKEGLRLIVSPNREAKPGRTWPEQAQFGKDKAGLPKIPSPFWRRDKWWKINCNNTASNVDARCTTACNRSATSSRCLNIRRPSSHLPIDRKRRERGKDKYLYVRILTCHIWALFKVAEIYYSPS